MKTAKMYLAPIFLAAGLLLSSCDTLPAFFIPDGKTADHTVVHQLWDGRISESDIQNAKDKLSIAYGHTSHGSQITTGMSGLVAFADAGNLGRSYTEGLFSFNSTGADGSLHLMEGAGYGSGYLELDAGYYPSWINETEEFLDALGDDYNVIMWSWCGQVSGISERDMIEHYLEPMNSFEEENPEITFVYMTGHLDGSGEDGNLHTRNEQIREYCRENDKWLFDFADIESYDPEGNYYLNRDADDACNYDGGNWAIEWQNSHTEDEDWYSCSSAHSQPLNANMKAYAAWWLFSEIASEM